MIKKVIIVGGHGIDSGAVAEEGTTERSVIEPIAKMIIDKLGSKICTSFGVFDELRLTEKISFINKYCEEKGLHNENTLLVSIHADWKGAKAGVGAYFSSDTPILARKHAEIITSYASRVGNRGIRFIYPDTSSRFNRLGILRTKAGGVLIEIGSLKKNDDPENTLEMLKNPKYQEKIADQIVRGIRHIVILESNLNRNEIAEKVSGGLMLLDRAENKEEASKNLINATIRTVMGVFTK